MITASGMRVTHRGWLWFCPVYLSFFPGDDSFGVEERSPLLAPVFWLAMQLEYMRLFVTSILAPDVPLSFGCIVTGEVEK